MVDIDTAIERLEKALGTLRSAKQLLNGGAADCKPSVRVKRKYRKVTESDIQEMRRLRKGGMKVKDIAKRLKRQESIIYANLK